MLNANIANANAERKSLSAAKGAVACAIAAALVLGGSGIAMAAPLHKGGGGTHTTTSPKSQVTRQTRATSQTTSKESTLIGDQSALEVACKDLGVTTRDCTEVEVELDRDGNRVHYDVNLKVGGYEHDYDIDAYNGTILSHTVDYDD